MRIYMMLAEGRVGLLIAVRANSSFDDFLSGILKSIVDGISETTHAEDRVGLVKCKTQTWVSRFLVWLHVSGFPSISGSCRGFWAWGSEL